MLFFKQFCLLVLGVLVVFNLPSIIAFFVHLVQFVYWRTKDLKQALKSKTKPFSLFGVRMFVGRQGAGKTIGMVYYAQTLKKQYPDCLIYSNFACDFADGQIQSLNDLLTIRNGTDGVVFMIDELQNEFSSATSKNFPETLLSVVTQQRKQRIVILATSQVFTRVAKPLREQCFEVVECSTYGGRWTRLKAFDADDYNTIIDCADPFEGKRKLFKRWRMSFVQTDNLRNTYDTYSVVARLSRDGFAPSASLRGDSQTAGGNTNF